MLKSWRLKNFKSFGEEPDLKLAAINVLAGANSSGKSSIIQSILLLKQTLQYGSENRTIALNGPLLRLGSFENVLNFESESKIIELGFEIEVLPEDFRSYPPIPWITTFNRFRSQGDTSPRTITLDLKWKQPGDDQPNFPGNMPTHSRLPPRLISTCLSMTRNTASGETDTLRLRFKLNKEAESSPDDSSNQFHYQNLDVELDKTTENAILEGKPEGRIDGGYLSYFMPSWVAVRYNSTTRTAYQIAEALCSPSNVFMQSNHIDKDEIPTEVIEHINGWLIANGQAPVDLDLDGEEFVATIRSSIRKATGASKGLLGGLLMSGGPEQVPALAKLRDEIATLMIKVNSPAEYETEPVQARNSTELRALITEYFKQGVRYLGPLRDSPRHVYQLEALESTTDVGYRGEHTAAVLDLNHNKRMRYVKPPDKNSEASAPLKILKQFGTLREAVVEWLAYLGVASDVRTQEFGVFGHQLQVSTHQKGALQDLTNVGVGVSQVLPIMVMAFLAHGGSLLIFEQPELHLHPKVQARLADFFIALAQDGKQIFLETHSEYLIDRLRLRIAQADGNKIKPLINILFSEKESGQSKLVPIEVSEYGAVTNWPRDFFDQSQSDVNAIIRAAAEKRRTQRES